MAFFNDSDFGIRVSGVQSLVVLPTLDLLRDKY